MQFEKMGKLEIVCRRPSLGEGDVLHWGSVVCAVTGKEAEIDWKHWVPLASLLALF